MHKKILNNTAQLNEICGAELYPAQQQKLPAQMQVSLHFALAKDKKKSPGKATNNLKMKEEVRQYVVLEIF